MKTKKHELDVDFIGGKESLTKEEEKLITEFINSRKKKIKNVAPKKKVATSKKSKV
jgi:hypothetical protein